MERSSLIQIVNSNIEMKNAINEKALEMGFFKTGVALPIVDGDTANNYTQWIDSGFHSEMKWMENNNEKRLDPNNILNGVKSVIVLAHSYNTDNSYSSLNNKISRYAWGDDYHEVLLNKLKSIESYIKSFNSTINTKSYVDTGAILEKYWAEKAGIGWQGKNSLIINKVYGSYFFIGIIFTDLELEPDTKHSNFCGNCSKCIDNCPPKAIIKEKVVNSEKCLSYWTIESKEREFPDFIKENLSGWVFGCDICQEVCPWNKKAIKVNFEEFQPRINQTNLDNKEISKLTPEQFNLRFKNSPIKRRKLKGIIRNLEYLNK